MSGRGLLRFTFLCLDTNFQLNHQHDMVARKETIVANMREKMRWLEMMQEESKDMKKECDKLKDALTACVL